MDEGYPANEQGPCHPPKPYEFNDLEDDADTHRHPAATGSPADRRNPWCGSRLARR